MAMRVNGNYSNSGTDYAERIKEKQAAEEVKKAKEATKAERGQGRRNV